MSDLIQTIASAITYGGKNKAQIPFSITQERLCEHYPAFTTLCWHVYIEVTTDRDSYEIITGDADPNRALSKAVWRLQREIPKVAA